MARTKKNQRAGSSKASHPTLNADPESTLDEMTLFIANATNLGIPADPLTPHIPARSDNEVADFLTKYAEMYPEWHRDFHVPENLACFAMERLAARDEHFHQADLLVRRGMRVHCNRGLIDKVIEVGNVYNGANTGTAWAYQRFVAEFRNYSDMDGEVRSEIHSVLGLKKWQFVHQCLVDTEWETRFAGFQRVVVEAVEALEAAVQADLKALINATSKNGGVPEEFKCLFEVDWNFTMGL
ncbi:hypothetical protein QBC39DRAFT_380990 [Podospora conica]|nr:hypothetical protein QBC39DRAFT_380990 [Schizothecium conicum]